MANTHRGAPALHHFRTLLSSPRVVGVDVARGIALLAVVNPNTASSGAPLLFTGTYHVVVVAVLLVAWRG